MAWFRNHLRKHPWKLPGNANAHRERFGELAKDFVKNANKEYDVEGLCRAMPSRLQKLAGTKGERLKP